MDREVAGVLLEEATEETGWKETELEVAIEAATGETGDSLNGGVTKDVEATLNKKDMEQESV
jgi:hypothetical protein